ncbi:MAG: response regulator transcription factor [candidate division KSB1 bacterium]|jgi:DNA-binding response OmpR family regulator|nr:response regulator transcription factor [candidate division KSB1 bacterium]
MKNKNDFSGSNILIVEDEKSLAIGLKYNLEEEGYSAQVAEDGREALRLFDEEAYDLVILDIMLPFVNGFEVAKKMRQSYPQLPILMLTARTGIQDRIHGLEIGADDYITKPFHLEELLARIKGMLKRKQWYQEISEISPVYRFGENVVDFTTLVCSSGEKKFKLTAREAMLLRYLAEHAGVNVTRKELLKNVWHIPSEVETRTVDNFIVRLRKLFEPDPANPVHFVSVRSVGYIFYS